MVQLKPLGAVEMCISLHNFNPYIASCRMQFALMPELVMNTSGIFQENFVILLRFQMEVEQISLVLSHLFVYMRHIFTFAMLKKLKVCNDLYTNISMCESPIKRSIHV